MSEIEYDNDYYKTRYLDSIKTMNSDSYCTDLWFNKAMEWMDQMAEKKQPFFTYLALNAPHGPFYSPEEDYKLYRPQVADSSTASFLGMIASIDRNMDRLNQWLSKKGLKDNTLIVFMNDNGGTGGVKLYNAGMRGEKGSLYEGGHRASCFIRWQNGNLRKPGTVSYPSEIQDLLPTFIDLFHLKVNQKSRFDGASLKPVLESAKVSDKRMFVVQYGGDERPKKYDCCVVWDSWRLIGENELYDLNQDPGQKNNVAKVNPEVLKKMKAFYEKWWAKTESGINQFVPVVVGSDKENPVTINSNNWEVGAVNSQWKIAQASGDPKGGICHIHVEKEGAYKIELSRWPFHLERDLTARGPSKSYASTKIQSGKAIPVVFGCLSINKADPIVASIKSGDNTKVTFEINLPAGDNILQAWFKDKDKNDLCGAYYVRLERLL